MQAKYEVVEAGLREQILAGEYKIGDKLPTETELMARYDVSRYTVRRAVGDLENEHMIYRIQGGGMYVNDWQSVKTEDQNTNRMIGILTTHIADYIFPNIISGADQIISDSGYALLLANTHNDPKRERRSLISMFDSNIAGLIIEPTQSTLKSPNADLYEKIRQTGLPTVFINATYPSYEAVSVTTDDAGAILRLTNYLIDAGHERILGAFQVDDAQGVNRMNGYIKAYQQHPDIALKSNVVMYRSMDSIKEILSQIEHYLRSPVETRPTAIMCYNDQLAIQVMDLVKSLDLRIPEDVSVTGFDDYSLGRYLEPGLTTMVHEKERMGHDAASLLLNMIDKRPVESIVYEPELVERRSVKKNN
ncbi:GntR family transcriptional regulator [Secundilactobacillus kimchicus]|uniref:Arabinose operon repressor n=1 Tax=Secundilactobacillus kimchicus JCM 15530 TaxID=1302272 RepID=A0A0R1HLJ3_9LACO|nr:GntR family transcriptional regulator [Secundilactobacillus kimchicus]KRK47630.1 arabinose operon repressor [Secundilactobacillus kimchicus JCM 15530]MBT9672187.1 GntR family transcriptional regulator [Secundilactobacillus kimchicus]